MKIEQLTIQGFRGFNERQSIGLHERLTLIYAPNSYGKTSISEALEWLLYGVTSKVAKADSKDEYKGCYRNRHLPESLPMEVKAVFAENGKKLVLSSEAMDDQLVHRFAGEDTARVAVETWPIACEMAEVPRPFILQHSLKYLLLATPDERFQDFARLLGVEDLDQIHRNIISLCTAPNSQLPPAVKELQQRVAALEFQVNRHPSLVAIQRALKKKGTPEQSLHSVILAECKRRVGPEIDEAGLLPELMRRRESATAQVFKGKIQLQVISPAEKTLNDADESCFVEFLTHSFIQNYLDLISLASINTIMERARFLEIGMEMLTESPHSCPFCGQPVAGPLAEHIQVRHNEIREQSSTGTILAERRTGIAQQLRTLRTQLQTHYSRNVSKTTALLALQPSLEPLREILATKHESHFQNVNAAIARLSAAKATLDTTYEKTICAIRDVEVSLESSTENSPLTTALGDSLLRYVADARSVSSLISGYSPAIFEADRALQSQLDALAGTEDVSVLIELTNEWRSIEKKWQIDGILERLKDLRRTIDEYVAEKVLKVIAGDLTSEVMQWYERIKTTGDPDVHFDGFDLERTARGEVKARRVRIKAQSYGTELVSAVSSLSESKLNALGLCVSIATNLRAESPFEFLIIDDPIQSLDAEHETQFIEVIRSLVEIHGKQVVLLSHNQQWLDQVCSGCRSLNGWYYQITGYTQAGPCIVPVLWTKWDERLKTVNAILHDATATSVRLQQAEEEIRIVVADLTCRIFEKRTGKCRSPHGVNSMQVKEMLLEAGVDNSLVDRIVETFGTTDASHHAPAKYAPNKDRISTYHSWARELARLAN